MIVIVTGGRHYNDIRLVYAVLDKLNSETPINLLVQGGATGADTLAKEWAIKRGVNHKQEDAKWKLYGPSAGPIRNAKMIADFNPDLVVAFPGNSGTKGMMKLAEKAGVKVIDCTGMKVRTTYE